MKLKLAGIKHQLIDIPSDLTPDMETHMKFHRRPLGEALPTMIYKTEKGLIAAQRRGDMRINTDKLKKLAGIKQLAVASKADLASLGVKPGVVPVVGLGIPVYIDKGVFAHKEIYSGTDDQLVSIKISPKDVMKLNRATIGEFAETIASEGKKRVLSGMRPTGRLHLGNYLGAAKGMIELQKDPDYEAFYTVVDLHAMTTPYEVETLRKNRREVILDYLAVGLDPEKSVIFYQSDSVHAELSFYLSTVVSVAQMQHLPTFKEKVKQHPQNVTMALLNYPVLMAADILAYKAGFVPVGIDQEPHLEVAREIARKMNAQYGLDFPEPQRFATKGEYVPSLTGEGKMSKSVDGSYIQLTDDLEMIKKHLASTPTDSGRGETVPAEGGVANLLTLVELFEGKGRRAEYEKAYQGPGIKYQALKEELAEAIYKELKPVQEKREELEAKPGYVDQVIKEGGTKARTVAEKTLKEVREKMGLG